MRSRRALGALIVLAALLTGPVALGPAQAGPPQPPASLELVAQTPLAESGEDFVVRLRLEGIPDNGSIELDLHSRVRSRSELELSIQAEALRNTIYRTVAPAATLPIQTDRSRRIVISLDPSAGGVSLPAAGVYPLVLTAKDAADNELATLVTHLIAPPDADDASPPLNVAVVARIGAPPALQPDGTTVIDRSELGDAPGLVGALRRADDVTTALAVTPETLDALEASGEPGDAELVDGLRQAAEDRTVMARPYVNASPDALVTAGLPAELGRQMVRGRRVLGDTLDATPTNTTWIADPDLGAAGLFTLRGLRARHVVVDSEQVAPLPDGLLDLSLAQTFLLAPPEDQDGSGPPTPSDLNAIALDPVVLDRLTGEGTPALIASRVLTELAVLWFEQPGVPRGAVLPVGADIDPLAVLGVLDGLRSGQVFAAVTLDELFEATNALVDPGDNPVARSLTPSQGSPITVGEADLVGVARASLTSFSSLVGADSPSNDPLERQLLLATATELTGTERQAHAQAVIEGVDEVAAGVSGPERFTLTLTARDGTVPLTLRNTSGIPLQVVVHLRSAKLEFPEGTEIPVTLTEPTTRLDIPVVARASGAFPLNIEVTSPDGDRRLVMSRYTVRSTAVAGAGLILSIGAGLFLIVWWARHWRRTRRSARLIASRAHPTAAPEHLAQ